MPEHDACEGGVRIRIRGHLDMGWAEWFDPLTITNLDDGDAILCGPVADEAALHGVLAKIRDLGLPLLSVHGSLSDR